MAFGAFIDCVHDNVSGGGFAGFDQVDVFAFEVVEEAGEASWGGGFKFGDDVHLSVGSSELEFAVEEGMTFGSRDLEADGVGYVVP